MKNNLGIFHDLLAILSKITSMSLAIFGTSGGMKFHRKSLTLTGLGGVYDSDTKYEMPGHDMSD